MQVTLQSLQDSFLSLGKLASADLPVKKAYWLSKIARAAESELKDMEAQRVKLVQKYGTEDEAGNWSVNEDNVADFAAEFGELLAESVDLPGDKITLDSLGDGLKLSAIDLIKLDWLIETGEE